MDAFLFDKERWEGTFPSLNLALQCIDKVHNPTAKSDIWRYLILWEYGGLYTNIDVSTWNFTASSIRPDDDGLLFVENEDGNLVQYFLAVSPRHPLMFYAVHAAVQNLLAVEEFGRIDIVKLTGEGAIADAMSAFMNNATAGEKVQIGFHIGENGRSVRVESFAHRRLIPDTLGYPARKTRIYAAMNMTHHLALARRSKTYGSCYNMMNATKIT